MIIGIGISIQMSILYLRLKNVSLILTQDVHFLKKKVENHYFCSKDKFNKYQVLQYLFSEL